ncbi:MAG: long-chain fatty acid--CoA ligase [Actinomycetota bacterium]|nr:long-chain fatty acid--CoA ligase [Actinomycetota bacterium]
MRTEEILSERAAIDREVDGKTLGDLFARNADIHADAPALSWKQGEEWKSLTWREYREQVAEVACGLTAMGIGPGDFVVIMARNRPEHLVADLGILHAGAIPVSVYNTLAPEQIAYIAGHCEAKAAVVEGRVFMERFEKVKGDLPALERAVLIEDAADFSDYEWVSSWAELTATGREVLSRDRQGFERGWRRVKPEDPATLVYTSGTTGPPKGVIITHRNVLWTCESLDRTGVYATGLRAVSYLPLAHSLERLATHYLGTYKAAHVHFCPEVLQVFELMPEIRPDAFAGVPRVWEKIQAGILAALAEEPNARRRKIALSAIEAGRQAARLEQAGKPVPTGLRFKRALFDRLVFSKIRHRLGLDRCRIAVSGAAPIAPDVLEFFLGIGIPIHEGYGMTECTAPSNLNRMDRVKVGTVGPALPGVEVRLAEDGEVLVRGGNVTPGYYKDSEQTAETFDAEGWLHTGDVGELDADGFLRIVDRKKELIITAGGKNISPANLESLLKQHPMVGQAAVIGDRRPYVAALVVLDGEVAPGWARENGVPFTDIASFTSSDRVRAEIQRAVDDANQHVSNVEAIKRFTILPTEWTVDSEELTPTLKLKRRVITEKYAAEIEALYAPA